MLKKDIIKVDDYFVLNCPYAEFYIPREYVDNDLASDNGEYYSSLGVFYLRTFSSMDKPNELEILKLPDMIDFFPHEKENRKMTINDVEESFIVLKFFKGERIMRTKITCSSAMPEKFLDIILKGKIPSSIPYDKILDLFIKTFDDNKVKLPAPVIILEMIISEVYRYKGDNAKKYGQVLAKDFDPKKKQLDYTTANIRSICKANSSFAGISFENLDEMLTSAINNNMYNRTETRTPYEDVIKY